ncbi:hypothetical protein PMG71_08895 [Roseofilum sp. BLCC_M154]|uniref:Uncharacterized protein n=1 Tax=Roseofilum acuticapitatum BLCC-M154 TaxID=3022444 RepID=A0ABT7ARK9_9CYAN|nr:hypothetical protein [Roseofilum acuticapitatum]MDJ1169540.1 hypothetical protein [Roseofilum acuticapitatum BLCC-M154]
MRELSYFTPTASVSADLPERQVRSSSMETMACVDRGLLLWIKSLIFLLLLGITSLGVLILALGVVSPVEEALEAESEG